MVEKQKGLFDKFLGMALWICVVSLVGLAIYWYLAVNNLLSIAYDPLSIFALLLSLDIISGLLIPILVVIVLILLIVYLWKQIRKKQLPAL